MLTKRHAASNPGSMGKLSDYARPLAQVPGQWTQPGIRCRVPGPCVATLPIVLHEGFARGKHAEPSKIAVISTLAASAAHHFRTACSMLLFADGGSHACNRPRYDRATADLESSEIFLRCGQAQPSGPSRYNFTSFKLETRSFEFGH